MPFQVNPQLSMSYQPSPGPLQQMGQIMTLADMMSQAKMRQYTMAEEQRKREVDRLLGSQWAQQLIPSAQTAATQTAPAIAAQAAPEIAPLQTTSDFSAPMPDLTQAAPLQPQVQAQAQAAPAQGPAPITVPTMAEVSLSDNEKKFVSQIAENFGWQHAKDSYDRLMKEKQNKLELVKLGVDVGKMGGEIAEKQQTVDIKNRAVLASMLNRAKDQAGNYDPNQYRYVQTEAKKRNINLPDVLDPVQAKLFVESAKDAALQHQEDKDVQEATERGEKSHLEKIKRVEELHGKFVAEDRTKDLDTVKDAWIRINSVRNLPQNGPNDMTLVINKARLDNPSASRMMSTEQIGMAIKAGGLGAQLQAAWQNLESGVLLSPKAREQFLGAADALYSSTERKRLDLVKSYSDQAKDEGIDEEHAKNIYRGFEDEFKITPKVENLPVAPWKK